MHVVIATHGEMAKGVFDALTILYGKQSNCSFIEGYVNSENFNEELEAHLSKIKEKTILILTDLVGGSVNQMVVRILEEKQLYVIAGFNLALVLRVLTIDENKDIPEQIRECIKRSQEQLLFVNKLIKEKEKD